MVSKRRLAIGLTALALGATACNGWPDTINGNSVGLAQSQVGETRASNPPYNHGGFDCYQFVNWVEDTLGTAGWHDAQGPGTFSYYLQPDPFGFTYGDIVVFGDPSQNNQAVHVGIVQQWNPGQTDFGSIEWNSPEDTNRVVVNQHPISGPDPITGLDVIGVFIP